jgi:hypothetical protein
MIGPMLCEHEWMTLGTSPEAWEHRRCKLCKLYFWQLYDKKNKQKENLMGISFEYVS